MVRPGGILVVNTSLINRPPHRTDITNVLVPANQIANDAGSAKAANMVALGALLGASGLVDADLVKAVLAETFAGRPKIVAVEPHLSREGHGDRADLRRGRDGPLTLEIVTWQRN